MDQLDHLLGIPDDPLDGERCLALRRQFEAGDIPIEQYEAELDRCLNLGEAAIARENWLAQHDREADELKKLLEADTERHARKEAQLQLCPQ